MSTRRESTSEQKRRMKKLVAIESTPEAISANRAKVQKIRQHLNTAQQTLAQQALALLLAEKDRQEMSLGDLEERCGITRSNLSKLWNDPEPNATLATIERIADAMGVKVSIALVSSRVTK